MSPELLSSIVAAIFSLLFAYVPGLKAKWSKLDGEYQAGLMGLIIVAVGVSVYLLTCVAGLVIPDVYLTCDQDGLWVLLKNILAALMANQAAYLLMVKPFKSAEEPV